MASENETFDEVFAEAMNRKAVRDYRTGVSNGMKLGVVRCVEDVVDHYAVRFRDAHRREVAELKNKCEEYERQPELMAETAKAALELLKAQESKIAELRECLKEAIDVACDGCKFAVWKKRTFVKCKKHKNWKCPFGTERWRKALEG